MSVWASQEEVRGPYCATEEVVVSELGAQKGAGTLRRKGPRVPSGAPTLRIRRQCDWPRTAGLRLPPCFLSPYYDRLPASSSVNLASAQKLRPHRQASMKTHGFGYLS
ncbi:hypothetical protein MRX96_005346 [Rhipicephalus microplus]